MSFNKSFLDNVTDKLFANNIYIYIYIYTEIIK